VSQSLTESNATGHVEGRADQGARSLPREMKLTETSKDNFVARRSAFNLFIEHRLDVCARVLQPLVLRIVAVQRHDVIPGHEHNTNIERSPAVQRP